MEQISFRGQVRNLTYPSQRDVHFKPNLYLNQCDYRSKIKLYVFELLQSIYLASIEVKLFSILFTARSGHDAGAARVRQSGWRHSRVRAWRRPVSVQLHTATVWRQVLGIQKSVILYSHYDSIIIRQKLQFIGFKVL